VKLVSCTLILSFALAAPVLARPAYIEHDPKGWTEGPQGGFGVVKRDYRPDGGPGRFSRWDFTNKAPKNGWGSRYFGFDQGGKKPFYGYHK
jgi:hypothetical protein